ATPRELAPLAWTGSIPGTAATPTRPSSSATHSSAPSSWTASATPPLPANNEQRSFNISLLRYIDGEDHPVGLDAIRMSRRPAAACAPPRPPAPGLHRASAGHLLQGAHYRGPHTVSHALMFCETRSTDKSLALVDNFSAVTPPSFGEFPQHVA